MRCLLCGETTRNKIFSNASRDFYRCLNCDLIFVPPCFQLNQNEEKKQYDFHQNNPDDIGYRNFLNQLAKPLLGYLTLGMKGLDFGSGPGPTLHKMLEDSGYQMKIYDPLYANYPENINQQYDFITCTEVVEHFCDPKGSWQTLVNLAKKQGYLGIMTLLHDNVRNFSTWWYKNDLTHVVFYSSITMQWIADKFELRFLLSDQTRVILFQT